MQSQQGINKKANSISGISSSGIAKHQFTTATSFSGSETDISTSSENLSVEQRYVLKHTPRIEPQGQENFSENQLNNNESLKCFSTNILTDSVRYTPNNRSSSEARNIQQVNGNNILNRNSLKEVNSNRSSMDISTCSYNTLIIHNDDNTYSVSNQEYSCPSPVHKKERPRSYGEQGMQEITEIPDDYLKQSHVLKHLAKEIKNPSRNKNNSIACGAEISEKIKSKEENFDWIIEESELLNKSKSKSQPDLTKSTCSEVLSFESLAKENAALKQQLLLFCMKVAKTQKLEHEVSNIYRVYEELVQSCERREKLERVARMRLQENLQKAQALNRALKDQVDVLQTQLLAPSEHQILIAQLFTQNKELNAAKERQDIELAAQQATLQEQRTHIGILDTALNNAQRNIRRLEEELRKKQFYVERLTQLAHSVVSSNQVKQNERKLRFDYETELSKESNQSCSSTNSDSKWQFQVKSNQLLRSDHEEKRLGNQTVRHTTPKLSVEKISQETGRNIADGKHEKFHYIEEVHSAQRKINDLQSHLEELENLLAEKDALIRVLQNHKINDSSSYDSYNLPANNFVLNRINSPSSHNNALNTTYNTTGNSFLESTNQNKKSNSFNITGTVSDISNYGKNSSSSSSYNGNVNMQQISTPRNYSPNSSSNFSTNYDSNTNYMMQNYTLFNTSSSYDKQYDEHLKKHIDEQLSKVSELQLNKDKISINYNRHIVNSVASKTPPVKLTFDSNSINNNTANSNKNVIMKLSCLNIPNKETFY